ncbi:hypothetical protein MMC11_008803 [Xylographa trunciseda]|nr:hypothetical protein [Xylographa trunciseda]
MLRSFWFSVLQGISAATAAASAFKQDAHHLVSRDNVSGEMYAFISSMSLSSSQVQSIASTYEQNSDLVAFLEGKSYSQAALTSLACYSARFVLGSGSVDAPVNATEADTNWSEACWQTPSCAIIPSNEQAVSISLLIINFFKVKFSIRSGGHSPNPGWSSIGQQGILIDMQKLNQITLSSDHTVASLGPGGRWGDVYQALDPYGLSVIGGRIPHVGVGGLILGGGYFHFSAKYGLAADNVKNFEIVLANGTITNANLQQNTDLFWALKGGGPNFGIVTRFDMYTVPIRNIWYSLTVYPNSEVSSIFNALVEWQNNGASDTLGTVAIVVGLEITEVGLLYAQPTYQPASFAPFYELGGGIIAIPPTNGTLTSLTTILGASQSQTTERHDYRAASSKIDAQLYKDVYAFWQQDASAVYNATGANQTFVIQPVPVSLVQAGNAKGGNALGMPNESFQCWTTLIDWSNASQDNEVRSTSIATTQKWQQLGQQRGLGETVLFMNDASRDQDPLAGYGATNLAKLKSISQKYDPSQVFQTLQSNGFLLSKA